MIWQDIVVGIVQLVFILALIPSLKGFHKPSYWTSVVTGACLWVLALVYASLHLACATLSALVLGCLWMVLAAQGYGQQRYRWVPVMDPRPRPEHYTPPCSIYHVCGAGDAGPCNGKPRYIKGVRS